MHDDEARRYTGGEIDAIADGSDPWLERPDGSVVDLAEHLDRLSVGPCGECRGGFFAPTTNGPTDQGVERCDACDIYDGDLSAALALAALIGPDVEVRYAVDADD
ncbi:hypothetical protein [Cellulomonas sp. SG140]|uniref:hypothetical protein n=1 Tax=Cellulomonas sp. SG140 TaxID=2976536 RepID=UPI0021E71F51|nr:hypothetical protein [Cellulomonas sp. SG140]